MALFVHHGPGLGPLAEGLVDRISAPGGDPFERLVVAVPTAGVRDWLTRRLAGDLGIASNIAMPFPGGFFAAAAGLDLGDDDPWSVERLTWAVLEVLDTAVVDVPGWDLARRAGEPSARLAIARRIADLFDRYATTRPEILRQWQRGVRGDGTMRATLAGGGGKTGGEHTVGALAPSMHWQFDLWRRVRELIGVPSRPELLPERVRLLRLGELTPPLPGSVELFGVNSLSATQLDLLGALAVARDVHVSLLHPSAVAWLRTSPVDPGLPRVRNRQGGDADQPAADSHPLLRSWARLSAETAALVRGIAPPLAVELVEVDEVDEVDGAVDPAPAPRPTLLAHLRADLQADRPPTPFARRADDTSIQVHACHGTIRQLEVLRDVLGHAFVADPTLRPDDVLVICPDLGRFEPFASGVLGRGGLPVPVTVSDLSLGSENPVAAALAMIVRTVAGRCTASDVLAIAALAPVRARLAISGDDLVRFADWCDRLGTTWGLDTPHRRAWLDADIDLGTWEQALRSLLLGVAMPAPEPRRAFAGIVPFDDIAGDDVPRAGRLAELVSRLRHVRRLAQATRPIGEWCDVLVDVVELLCASPAADAWQTATVIDAIEELRRAACPGGADSSVPIELDDIVAVVDGIVTGRRGRLQLRTGRVAITGGAPVRNVPARVVCLLGFDESSLRGGGVDGDDLLAVRPCIGERDRHAERRHVLLDAVFAAEDALIIMCDGADPTTNRPVRLAVQLSELLEVLDASLEPAGAARSTGESSSPVLARHPLHAYDESNFDLTASASRRGFDDVMCTAAERRRHRGEATPSWRRWETDVAIPETVTLRQLTDACVRPARTLLREALDVRLPDEVERSDHNIPLSVTRLETAWVGRRLLDRYVSTATARHAGRGGDDWEAAASAAVEEWARAERLSSSAPPGRLIDETLTRVAAEVDAIAATSARAGFDRLAVLAAGESIDVDLEIVVTGTFTPRPVVLPDRLRLVDTVRGIADGVIWRLAYRRPKPSAVLAAALDLAAVIAASGDAHWRAFTATRAPSGSSNPETHLLEVAADDPQAAARTLLGVAAELRIAAFRGAVPVFEVSTKRLFEDGILDEEELVGTDYRTGDLDDVANHFVWGDVAVADLVALSPSPHALAVQIWGAVTGLAKITKFENKARR